MYAIFFYMFCILSNILCVCLATFTISAIVVVYCLDNCCLLFKKCAREGGCQGAPGHWNRVLFESVWAPFFKHFFGVPFFTQMSNLWRKLLPKWTPNIVFLKPCFRTKWKWKSVFGLRRRVRIAYEPIPGSAQGDKKNEEKQQPISGPLFFSKKQETLQKRPPTSVQKGDSISGLAPLGAACGSLGAPIEFVMQQMLPKSSQNDDEMAKVTPKDTPWT